MIIIVLVSRQVSSMAKHNKVAKSFPMWPRRSIEKAQFSKYKNHDKSEQAIFSMLSTPKC